MRRAGRGATEHGAVGRLRRRRARRVGLSRQARERRLRAIDLEPTRIYRADDARQFLEESGLTMRELAAQVDGRFMSAFVRASKPRDKACCSTTCCGN